MLNTFYVSFVHDMHGTRIVSHRISVLLCANARTLYARINLIKPTDLWMIRASIHCLQSDGLAHFDRKVVQWPFGSQCDAFPVVVGQ